VSPPTSTNRKHLKHRFTCSTRCAQTHRQSAAEVQRSPYAEKRPAYGEKPMLWIIGAVIALLAVVPIRRVLVPGGVPADHLGWMSEQWLAEHRASSPSR
jgi:hypothetical protein